MAASVLASLLATIALELTGKKDGKVVITGRIVVSADGLTRTVNTSGTDSTSKKTKVVRFTTSSRTKPDIGITVMALSLDPQWAVLHRQALEPAVGQRDGHGNRGN